MKQARTNSRGFVRSFSFAFTGMLLAASDRNFRVQLCCAVLAFALAVWLNANAYEWVIIILCAGMVLGAEAMNTALETVVDLASPEYHFLARKAKDCAAGSVLLLSFASLAIAAIIFIPKILNVVSQIG